MSYIVKRQVKPAKKSAFMRFMQTYTRFLGRGDVDVNLILIGLGMFILLPCLMVVPALRALQNGATLDGYWVEMAKPCRGYRDIEIHRGIRATLLYGIPFMVFGVSLVLSSLASMGGLLERFEKEDE